MTTEWRFYRDFKHTRDFSRVPDYRSFNTPIQLGIIQIAIRTTGVAFDVLRPSLTFSGDFTNANYAVNVTSGKGYFVESAVLNNDGTTSLTMIYDVWANSRGHEIKDAQIVRTTSEAVSGANGGTVLITGDESDSIDFINKKTDNAYLVMRLSIQKGGNDTPIAFIVGEMTYAQAFDEALRIYRTREVTIANEPLYPAYNARHTVNNIFDVYIIPSNVLNPPSTTPMTIDGLACQYLAFPEKMRPHRSGSGSASQIYFEYEPNPFYTNYLHIGSARLPLKLFSHKVGEKLRLYFDTFVSLGGVSISVREGKGALFTETANYGNYYDITEQFTAIAIIDNETEYRKNGISADLVKTVSGVGAVVSAGLGIAATIASGGAAAPIVAGVVGGVGGVSMASQGIKGFTQSRPAQYVGESNFLRVFGDVFAIESCKTSNAVADAGDLLRHGRVYNNQFVQPFTPRVEEHTAPIGEAIVLEGASDYYQFSAVHVSGVPVMISEQLENIYKRGVEIFALSNIYAQG